MSVQELPVGVYGGTGYAANGVKAGGTGIRYVRVTQAVAGVKELLDGWAQLVVVAAGIEDDEEHHDGDAT